jgi:hypothetical protein
MWVMKPVKEIRKDAAAAAQVNEMKLFGKKTEKETPACACSGNAEVCTDESEAADSSALKSVKVLGSGCKSCEALLKNTNEALQNMKAPLTAEYITDMTVIAGYGIMSTPALVVNERVVAMGKVLTPAEVEKLLHKIGF